MLYHQYLPGNWTKVRSVMVEAGYEPFPERCQRLLFVNLQVAPSLLVMKVTSKDILLKPLHPSDQIPHRDWNTLVPVGVRCLFLKYLSPAPAKLDLQADQHVMFAPC